MKSYFKKNVTASGAKKDVSREFAEYLDEIDLKDKGKVFHSFRHTFVASMNDKGVSPITTMKIVGHSKDLNAIILRSVHAQVYNKHVSPIKILKEAADEFDSKLTQEFKDAFKAYLSTIEI